MDTNEVLKQLVLAEREREREKVCQWITELCHSETRENALLQLCVRRHSILDLGLMLWDATGVIAALLFEIVNAYQYLSPPTITELQVMRLCNTLALLQCVAEHPSTWLHFIQAQLPLYIYPYIQNTNQTRNFEHLRLATLGVIGSLIKSEEPDVIKFLLATEIVPLCLYLMDNGFELTKTMAALILQKFLMNATGLSYICETYERFSHVVLTLGKMVLALETQPSTRLLKNVVGCYVCLSENLRAREALKQCLPNQLTDMSTFAECIARDQTIAASLILLKKNLESLTPMLFRPVAKDWLP